MLFTGIGKLNLNAKEKQTFKIHIAYSAIEGIILGVLALNEFVFIKSLHGSNYQLGVLFQFSMLVFIFLVFFNEFLKRYKNKRKLLRLVAIYTRLPLIFLAFFPNNSEAISGNSIYHYIFLLIFLVYYFGNPIIYPTINLFLRNKYENKNFGKLFGYATSLNKIITLIATLIYGILLDANHFAFTYIFPIVAILGILSLFLLSKIDCVINTTETIKQKFWTSVKKSILEMFRILKSNRPYRDFEIGFMFYGFSFMITTAVITIFFEKALNLNYSSFAFYKNAYNILAIILLPLSGKILGKIDPRKYAAITFASLLLYLLFLTLTEYYPLHFDVWRIKIYFLLIPAYIFYGIFAASMSLLWFIGSAYFCKNEDAGTYQSVHLSLTSVRAMFAPLLGVFFYELIGFTGTFAIAIISLGIAISVMYYSFYVDRKKKRQ